MIFKKRKQNKIKPPGRKRKIFTTIALSLSLMFGKARLSSSQSPSSNFYNQTIHERVINDRDANSFEDNHRQVILAKAEGNPVTVTPPTNRGPSNFPTPLSGGRLSQPLYVPKYRTAPKVTGVGTGANPAGAGGGGGAAEFDDQCPVSKEQKSQESETLDYDYRWKKDYSYLNQNKKKLSEQCDLDENSQDAARTVTEKLDQPKSVKKLVDKALSNKKVKKEYDRIKKRLEEGVNPIDIGKKTTAVGSDKVLIKGAHGRYLVEVSGNQVNILGICYRGDKKNIDTFERLMNEMYDLNIQY